MKLVATASVLALLAALSPASRKAIAGEDKEALGFDEVLPPEDQEEQREQKEPREPKQPTEPAGETEEREGRRPGTGPAAPTGRPVEPKPPARRERPSGPRGFAFEIRAGGLFPAKGEWNEHRGGFAVGARAAIRLGPRAGLAVGLDYASVESDRGASDLLLADAGLRLRLSGRDISTCPLYAGIGVGFAAEAVADDYVADLAGNMGLALKVGLGVRLGPRAALGLGYVLLPDSVNTPGLGVASLGYSF